MCVNGGIDLPFHFGVVLVRIWFRGLACWFGLIELISVPLFFYGIRRTKLPKKFAESARPGNNVNNILYFSGRMINPRNVPAIQIVRPSQSKVGVQSATAKPTPVAA